MKHGVIMVFSLILALCLMGVVSANENVTDVCEDTVIYEENIQIDSIEMQKNDYDSGIREDEIIYEFILNIFDIKLCCTCLLGSFFKTFDFSILAYIACNANYFTTGIVFVKPGNDDRGIKTTWICENNFFDFFCHFYYSFYKIIFHLLIILKIFTLSRRIIHFYAYYSEYNE